MLQSVIHLQVLYIHITIDCHSTPMQLVLTISAISMHTDKGVLVHSVHCELSHKLHQHQQMHSSINYALYY
jgi:hypothetical protein